jgi:hypothetical protein
MNDTPEKMARRLQRIEDREAIQVLVGRYTLAMDNKDFDLIAAIFAENGRFGWIDGSVLVEGRDEIVAMYRSRLSDAGPSFHFTHDQFVEWDENDGNRATGLVLGHAETCSNGEQFLTAIRYSDRYVRSRKGWQFEERLLGFLYYVPVAEYRGILAKSDRIRLPGKVLPGHWPQIRPPAGG